MRNPSVEKLTLASYYLDVDKPASALRSLDGVDESVLDDAEYWRIRGSALYLLERYGEAFKVLSEGLKLAPEDAPLLQLLSNTSQAQGDLAAAERAILRALHIYPEDPSLLADYAKLLASAGRFKKADQLLREAALIDPESTDLLLARYVLATFKGNDREAGQYGEKLLAQAPDDPNAFLASGASLMYQGSFRRGYDKLKSAARSDPSVVEGLEEVFHEGRMVSHWLLVPLWPVYRFGPWTMWLSGIVMIYGSYLMGFTTISGILAMVWIPYLIYSWVAPPLVRLLLRRFR